ncbi:Wadjet anti-phage system protein JetD domain-containing protein [Specibacter sp. NPDC057265]|uniref:Wadjet anti-phage system protein JetD domain-containing protein n=1 Tax=Specibacter sp. NPDC057265 TaxID=3346075 RepID=UPI003628BA0C
MSTDPPRWTTPGDVRTAALRSWNSGELLREATLPTGVHPRRRALKHPTATQLRTNYALAAAWAASWEPAPRACSLEHVSVGANTIGANTLPAAAVFASAGDEILFLGLGREAASFAELFRRLAGVDARLSAWAMLRPLELLKYGQDALTAARVAVWFAENPAPGIYLRQLSLPGVHTKFVESHRRLIDGMLAVLCPERPLGGRNYARRHGFRTGPDRVRVRYLDPAAAPMVGMDDLEMTAAAFAAHPMDIDRIITTENLVNFLALPPAPRTLAVFGGGYGFEGIRNAAWLAGVDVAYWGDIDTHGFHILDQLRSHHPHVRSILMDAETLLAHRDFWGREDAPSHATLTRLDDFENTLYQALKAGTHQRHLRLEQELLRWDWVLARLP